MRVFLAHAKADSDERIAEWQTAIKGLFAAQFFEAGITEDVEVIPGRDDFNDNVVRAGGWRGWPDDVTRRLDYETQQPYYEAIVVPSKTYGKGTAAILEGAFGRGRFVYFYDGEKSELQEASGQECLDSKDYWNGWKLVFSVEEEGW